MFLRLYSKDIVKPMNMDYVFGIKTKYHRLCCFLVFFLEYREYKMSIFGICFILYAQLRFLKKYFRVSWEVPENASPCIKCKIYFCQQQRLVSVTFGLDAQPSMILCRL